jgi:heat-inducible transcriptional repressor
LVILVSEDGQIENRVISVPAGLPVSSLTEASNFLNAHVRGHTLAEARIELENALAAGKAELDQLTQKIVSAGFASWSGGESYERKLIVRGAAHLLDDLKAVEDLERVRLLFDDLETKRGVVDLLGRVELADGAAYSSVGNKLLSPRSSTIAAPYRDSAGRIIGVIGVIAHAAPPIRVTPWSTIPPRW